MQSTSKPVDYLFSELYRIANMAELCRLTMTLLSRTRRDPMAKKHCGGKKSSGPKTVQVTPHKRSRPGDRCHGPGKPGPKSVQVDKHKRSKP